MEFPLRLLAPISDTDLLELSSRNRHVRLERDAKGRLVVSPPTGGRTGRSNAELAGQLYVWNLAHGGGELFDSSTGFRLQDSSVLSPDAAWIARYNWLELPEQVRVGFLPIAPDFAVELLSRRDEGPEARAKICAYLENGVRVALLLDPFRRIAEISTAFNPAPVPQIGERLVLPAALFEGATGDLELDLARIFSP